MRIQRCEVYDFLWLFNGHAQWWSVSLQHHAGQWRGQANGDAGQYQSTWAISSLQCLQTGRHRVKKPAKELCMAGKGQ